MKLFKRTGIMTAAGFVRGSVLFVILLCFQLPSVCSAPLASSSSSFYDRLYRKVSEQNCLFLPNVSKVNYNYTRSNINRLCDSNVVAEESVNLSTERNNIICNSLSDIFPLLCNVRNSSRNANISTALDLLKIDSLGIKNVCANLKEITSNISQRQLTAKVVPPSKSEASVHVDNNGIEESTCMSLCSKSRVEGFNEYSKLKVHPACILLLKGYTIFEQIVASNQNQTISKTIVDETSLRETTRDNMSAKGVKEDDHGIALESNTKNYNQAVAIPTKKNKLQQSDKNGITEDMTTTSSPTASKKEMPLKQAVVASQKEIIKSSNNNQKALAKSDQLETSTKLSSLENDNDMNMKTQPEKKNPSKTGDKGQQKNNINAKIPSSKSTSTTTTTVAAVEAIGNDEPVPMEDGNKVKSSTALPKPVGGLASSVVSRKEAIKDNKALSEDAKTQMEKNTNKPINAETKKQVQKQSNPKKKIDENDSLAQLGDREDNDEYNNPGEEEDLDIGVMKPPSVNDDKENEIPQPDVQIQNSGYEQNPSFKPSKSGFSGNAFREDLDFSRGTTINVSYKESEDTGFFSYFLFCVTLVGVIYLVIHNKKKLIAFVVEGKRPRGRSRRSSSSSQYRRLENNFD